MTTTDLFNFLKENLSLEEDTFKWNGSTHTNMVVLVLYNPETKEKVELGRVDIPIGGND